MWYNGGMKIWHFIKSHWPWVVAAVIIVIAGALISAFRSYWFCSSIIEFFDDWSVALSAGAAVILAIAAFRAIRISSEQKQLLSNQTEFLDKQIRFLRQERLLKILDYVHVWANDMTNFRLEIQKGRTQEQIRVLSIVHWTAALKAQETNGKSLKRQTENIWPILGLAIDEVLNKIENLRGYLLLKYQGKNQNAVALVMTNAINTSAQSLLTEADNVKASVLSQ